jgi:hypothetical protein
LASNIGQQYNAWAFSSSAMKKEVATYEFSLKPKRQSKAKLARAAKTISACM